MAKNVLSIIPARKGSKGIPRKNIRELNNKPLIAHAIETSKNTPGIDHTILTTDSNEIAQIGREYDVDEVIHRPKELATDEVPLAPVIEHAYAESSRDFEYVLCFQPTVPLITNSSVGEGIQLGLQNSSDSVIYVKDSTHQYWKEIDGEYKSVSSGRKNRQQMEPIYEEVGMFLSHRSLVENGQRIGDDPSFYEVERKEGVDIDTYEDWKVAESILQRKQLVYRLTGNGKTGTGHVYRGITLADHIFEHDIVFVVGKKDKLAMDKLAESNYEYRVFDDEQAILEYIESNIPDVVVNDILDTNVEYMQSLTEIDSHIVNFEDLGVGSKYADAIINALYEHSTPPENHYFGSEYFCLRSEFRYATPLSAIPSVERIMVSFGGTDENYLTAKTLRALSKLDGEYQIDVVLGLGYTGEERLDTIIDEFPPSIHIDVSQNINSMAKHMEQADLLITSNGRTLYEAASLNLPMISIAQNTREQKHPFAHISRGVLSLGHANYVSEENLRAAVEDYCSDREQREMMRQELATHDIANGIERIKKILFEETNEN
ncbi:glycosyltransferase [Halorubrum ezzemoulense]|uniref:cytidylyltransferase domain-containing protein n=1 Tax=Halorubrum ezzemoulense TaxID=337243 RepID=UPI00232DF90C|nr:glycosyltransferase [Halorubrum ezzemoulense]MDB2286716.1 glycosyltransferase [Halorubrum ezzemoulense]